MDPESQMTDYDGLSELQPPAQRKSRWNWHQADVRFSKQACSVKANIMNSTLTHERNLCRFLSSVKLHKTEIAAEPNVNQKGIYIIGLNEMSTDSKGKCDKIRQADRNPYERM